MSWDADATPVVRKAVRVNGGTGDIRRREKELARKQLGLNP